MLGSSGKVDYILYRHWIPMCIGTHCTYIFNFCKIILQWKIFDVNLCTNYKCKRTRMVSVGFSWIRYIVHIRCSKLRHFLNRMKEESPGYVLLKFYTGKSGLKLTYMAYKWLTKILLDRVRRIMNTYYIQPSWNQEILID